MIHRTSPSYAVWCGMVSLTAQGLHRRSSFWDPKLHAGPPLAVIHDDTRHYGSDRGCRDSLPDV
eukprot:scaffold2149_cov172-Amphora_coffeaeformis.AAC.8